MQTFWCGGVGYFEIGQGGQPCFAKATQDTAPIVLKAFYDLQSSVLLALRSSL